MATVVLTKLVALADITNPYALVATELLAAYAGNKLDQALMGRRRAPHAPDVATSRSEYGLAKRACFGRVQVGGNQIEGWDKIKSLKNGHVRTALMHSLGLFPYSPVVQKITTSGNKVPYDVTATKNDLKFGMTISNGLMVYWNDNSVDPNWSDYNSGLTIPDETPSYSGSAAGGIELRVSIWDWRIDKKYGGSQPDLVYTVASSVVITLDMIFKYVCEQYGLIDGDHFDFSNLSSIKIYDPDDEANFGDGWVWEEGMSGLEFLDKLCKVYFLDLVEVDYQLVAQGWGQASSATLDDNEVGVSMGTDRTYSKPFVDSVTGDLTKFPLFTYVNYQSKELDFQRGQATGFHVGANTSARVSEAFPWFTYDAVAAKVAQTMNDAAWIRDTERTTSVSFRRKPFVCSDVITMTADGITRDWKISHKEYDPLGSATWTLIPEDGSIVTQAGNLGSSGNGGDGGDHQPPVPSKAVVFSAPDIQDSDVAVPRIYIVVCGDGADAAKWVEATAYMQRAGGSDWVPLGVMSKTGIIGAAVGALSASGATAGAFDATNHVDIAVDGGNVLSGTTEDAARNLPYPSNYAWLQIGDSGELIAYAGASLVSGNWRISNILRGLRGSDLGVHAPADLFAVLDPAQSQVYDFPAPQDAVDEVVTIRVVSDGQDISDIDVFETTVKIARPRGNAVAPEEIVASGPTYLQGKMYRIFSLRYKTLDPTPTQYRIRWQRNLNSGGFKGWDGTSATYWYSSETFQDSIAKGDTLQIRAEAISPNGEISAPLTTSNFLFIFNSSDGMLSPVRCATTAPLPSCTYSAGVLSGTSVGALAAQDGVTLALGESVLVKDQVTDTQNGPYVVTRVGDGSHAFILTRRDDFDNTDEIVGSVLVPIQEGATLHDHVFELTTDAPITLDTTGLVWEDMGVFTGGGSSVTWWTQIEAGDGTTGPITLDHVPISGTLRVVVRRLVMWDTIDYTIASGDQLTWVNAIDSGDPIWIQGAY
jgi:hypothetical protein